MVLYALNYDKWKAGGALQAQAFYTISQEQIPVSSLVVTDFYSFTQNLPTK